MGVGGAGRGGAGAGGTGAAGTGVGAGRGAGAGKGAGLGGAGAGAGASAGANDGGDGSGASSCKRGIAANSSPGDVLSPGVTWWYNWGIQGAADVEFVPMVWGKDSVGDAIPAGSRFLLTFNEPNFHAQSNLTAAEAAALWPGIEATAKAAGIPIVSPGMNFCGPAANCNGTDPYQYLKDFFAACSGCQVDYVAVHWYNCDLPSLQDYLEPGGNLEGFEQFGRPIWLTEFSCNGDATATQQEQFMRAAVPYLEANPHVFRYSWFSADPIPSARLVDGMGAVTPLGEVYRSLADNCQ
jgi:hypothetical protein